MRCTGSLIVSRLLSTRAPYSRSTLGLLLIFTPPPLPLAPCFPDLSCQMSGRTVFWFAIPAECAGSNAPDGALCCSYPQPLQASESPSPSPVDAPAGVPCLSTPLLPDAAAPIEIVIDSQPLPPSMRTPSPSNSTPYGASPGTSTTPSRSNSPSRGQRSALWHPVLADRSVMYVDDEAVNRNIGRRMLRQLGCRVALFDDGVQVEPAVATSHFDVVLLDIQMRRLNGDVVCRALRAHGYDTLPIIAVTGVTAGVGDIVGRWVVGSLVRWLTQLDLSILCRE